MIYEWRTYKVIPGRMPALHQRFRDITLNFFKKHEIDVVAFFEESIGENNQLHYIVRYPNLAERERRWGAFQSDPDWLRAKAETEQDGQIVAQIHNHIIHLTEYSPAL